MSISRWFYELLEMLNWMEGGEEEWGEFLFNPTITTRGTALSDGDPDSDSSQDAAKFPEIPSELPILPLRGVVVYPLTGVPLTIGQPRSIKLVDDVVAGDRLVGLVASRSPELETPGPEDLYQVGTVASVHRLFRAPDGTIRLLVQGISRFQL
ncbi:MAG: LON peptidase substrate-binding domain-containing protein, partial [Anaerolineales bacterium]